MTKLTDITQEALPAFQALLEKVNEQEKRAGALGAKIVRQLEELSQSGVIDGYNFSAELSCFSSDEEVNRKYHVEDGNPIMIFHCYTLPNDKNDFLAINWNEETVVENTLLEGLHLGYAMHCICFHENLSLEDILAIDSIWIDLKVDYQFETNLRSSPPTGVRVALDP